MSQIEIHRTKGSDNATHPIMGDELRALRKWQRHQPKESPFIFITWSGVPMSAAMIWHIVKHAGKRIGLERTHPHMLRHGCGYYLVNKGIDIRLIQAYLGHRNIQHTVRYTQLTSKPFTNLWS